MASGPTCVLRPHASPRIRMLLPRIAPLERLRPKLMWSQLCQLDNELCFYRDTTRLALLPGTHRGGRQILLLLVLWHRGRPRDVRQVTTAFPKRFLITRGPMVVERPGALNLGALLWLGPTPLCSALAPANASYAARHSLPSIPRWFLLHALPATRFWFLPRRRVRGRGTAICRPQTGRVPMVQRWPCGRERNTERKHRIDSHLCVPRGLSVLALVGY